MISAQFLQNCQAGNEEAIETLVRTYQRGVFQLALSVLDDSPLFTESSGAGLENDLESATQAIQQTGISISEAVAEAESATLETFTIALNRLGHYREDIPFNLWLYSIALEVARRRKRRLKLCKWWQTFGRKTVVKEAAPETAKVLPNDKAMWAAVRRLDDKLRIPVVLHYYHELPIDQIGLLMHLSEGAVHARLDAAREKITQFLENRPH